MHASYSEQPSEAPLFPPLIVADEPIGIEFERYKHWESVQAKIFLHDQTVLSESPAVAESFPLPESDEPILEPNPFLCSRGAATWNRREGGLARVPPSQVAVGSPLTGPQRVNFAKMC
jgi:hypothetical protein